MNYSLGRIPIGSCDFSLDSHEYSLKHDKKYIIPILKEALMITNLELFASHWSPPKKWKSNKKRNEGGYLLEKHYSDFIYYLLNFINDYKSEGITISNLTIQNEPNALQKWESCLYTSYQEAKILKEFALPILEKEGINLFVWDHNKDCLYERVKETLKEENLISKVKGIAYYWYTGSHVQNLDLVKQEYPNLLLYHTESCCGFSKYNEIDWIKDAESLGLDIILDMNHYMNGYIDWNLVLDENGGPNWCENYCKAPIMLTKSNKAYIKTPIYYYFAHFSKYIKKGYKRIAISSYSPTVFTTGFKNDREVVIVIINPLDISRKYNICLNDNYYSDELLPHTIVTYCIDV